MLKYYKGVNKIKAARNFMCEYDVRNCAVGSVLPRFRQHSRGNVYAKYADCLTRKRERHPANPTSKINGARRRKARINFSQCVHDPLYMLLPRSEELFSYVVRECPRVILSVSNDAKIWIDFPIPLPVFISVHIPSSLEHESLASRYRATTPEHGQAPQVPLIVAWLWLFVSRIVECWESSRRHFLGVEYNVLR